MPHEIQLSGRCGNRMARTGAAEAVAHGQNWVQMVAPPVGRADTDKKGEQTVQSVWKMGQRGDSLLADGHVDCVHGLSESKATPGSTDAQMLVAG